jgi:hypothetical protein
MHKHWREQVQNFTYLFRHIATRHCTPPLPRAPRSKVKPKSWTLISEQGLLNRVCRPRHGDTLTKSNEMQWQHWWLPCILKTCANVTTAMAHTSYKNLNPSPNSPSPERIQVHLSLPHPASLHMASVTFLSKKRIHKSASTLSVQHNSKMAGLERCETTSIPGTTSFIGKGQQATFRSSICTGQLPKDDRHVQVTHVRYINA